MSDPTLGASTGATSTSLESSSAVASAPTTSAFIPVQPQDLPPVPVPEQTSESAVEFLQWWVAMLNRVELTGETELIRQHSLPECVFCNGQIDNIESTFSTGARIQRVGDTTFEDLVASPVDLNGYVLIDLVGATPPGRKIDADGNVIAEGLGSPAAPYVVGVQWSDGSWLFSELANAGGADN